MHAVIFHQFDVQFGIVIWQVFR